MTDIVTRLRIRQPLLGDLCDEAADEIERLRAEVEHLRTTLEYLVDNINEDFERTVIYRGIKIEPTMAVGERSPLARAIRDELRKKSEQFIRGKLQQLSVKSR